MLNEPGSPDRHGPRRTRPLATSTAALITPATFAIGALLLWLASPTWFIDLRVYVLGAAHAFSPDLYEQKLGSSGLPFTYPPFAAVIMAPLAHAPFAAAATLVGLTSFAALWLITRALLRHCGHSPTPVIVTGLTVAALALEPVWATFSFGQVNLVVMALVLLDLGGRHRFGGVGLGVAAGLKLTPLFFVAYLFVTRRHADAARAVFTFAATVALGFAVNPQAAHAFWGDAVRDSSRVGAPIYAGNQALTGILGRLGADEPFTLAVRVAAAVAALTAAAVLARRGRAIEGLITASAGALAVSPISWSHHWVWAWPALLVLGCAAGRRRTRRATLATVLFAAVYTARSIWWPPSGGDAELTWGISEHLAGNLYLPAMTAWVIWALRRSARRHPRRPPSASARPPRST